MLLFLFSHTDNAENAFDVQAQMPCSSTSAAESSQVHNTKRPSNRNYKRHCQIRSKDANTTMSPSNTPHNANDCRKRPRFVQGMYNNVIQISITI